MCQPIDIPICVRSTWYFVLDTDSAVCMLWLENNQPPKFNLPCAMDAIAPRHAGLAAREYQRHRAFPAAREQAHPGSTSWTIRFGGRSDELLGPAMKQVCFPVPAGPPWPGWLVNEVLRRGGHRLSGTGRALVTNDRAAQPSQSLARGSR